MKKTALMLAFALSIVFVGCNDKKENKEEVKTEQEATTETATTTENSDLNHSWELTAITTADSEGKTLEQLFPGKKPALTFEGTDSVHGNDGCNSLTGGYEAKENNGIAIGDKFAVTKMYCEGVSDNAFHTALQSVTSYEIKDGELNFIAGDKVVLKFKNVDAAE